MMNGSKLIVHLFEELILEKQGIVCLLNERGDNNKFIVNGKERKDCIEYRKNLTEKIDNLSKEKTQYECLIKSTNQLITSPKKDQNLLFISQ